jgi:hypothetical protein
LPKTPGELFSLVNRNNPISHSSALISSGGFIRGMHTPAGLGQQGCKWGAKKTKSGIWHNFQGFPFFEVKLKLIIQCPYCRKWHF